MRIGFNHVSVKCYCRGCYHIFMSGYNSCSDFPYANTTCPYCGTNEKVVSDDNIFYKTYARDLFKHPVIKRDLTPEQIKENKDEIKELDRIERLLKTHGVGWYPPEDYP